MKIFIKKIDFYDNIGYNIDIRLCIAFLKGDEIACQVKSQFMM